MPEAGLADIRFNSCLGSKLSTACLKMFFLSDNRCAKDSDRRFGYLGDGRTIACSSEWSHAKQALDNTEI